MIHIMLDLETLGTKPDSAILSIGAVIFDPHAVPGVFGGRVFHAPVALDDAMRHGTVDANTILWWINQANEAKQIAFHGSRNTLSRVLTGFTGFLVENNPLSEPLRLWCCGPDFDAVILAHAYRSTGIPVPWRYNEVRCMRTICEAANLDRNSVPRDGVEHSALDDAKHQAKLVQMAFAALNTPVI